MAGRLVGKASWSCVTKLCRSHAWLPSASCSPLEPASLVHKTTALRFMDELTELPHRGPSPGRLLRTRKPSIYPSAS